MGRNRFFFPSLAFLVGMAGLAAGAILFFPHSGNSVIGQQWTQIGPAPLAIDAEQNFQGNASCLGHDCRYRDASTRHYRPDHLHRD